MNNKKSRAIRKALGLDRIPKSMSKDDRELYRKIKVQYNLLPKNKKRKIFLDDVTGATKMMAQVKEKMEKTKVVEDMSNTYNSQ